MSSPAVGTKRTLLEAIASDEPTLWLKLASGDRLPAHRELLKFSSGVVKALPPGDTWDLSGLQVEGQQVSKEVVIVWLSNVYDRTENAGAAEAGAESVPLAGAAAGVC